MAKQLPREITCLLENPPQSVSYGNAAVILIDSIISPIYTLTYARSVIPDGLEAYIERVDPDGHRYFEPEFEVQVAVEDLASVGGKGVIARSIGMHRYEHERKLGLRPVKRRERFGNASHMLGWLVNRGLPLVNLMALAQIHLRTRRVQLIEEYAVFWGVFPNKQLPQDRQVLVFLRSDEAGMSFIHSDLLESCQLLLVRDP